MDVVGRFFPTILLNASCECVTVECEAMQPRAAREETAAARDALASELALLTRILRVSRLQHGRALYYHRLRDAHKRLTAALACCAPTLLAASDGKATAHACIERALDAIPSPWRKLRHLLAQTELKVTVWMRARRVQRIKQPRLDLILT